ncbi:MAG: hypothetical protein ACKO1F_07050 [Flammeovirgaceae bacterium]
MEGKHEFTMDENSYAELLAMLNNLHLTEKSGADHDLRFIYEDWWLGDTAVIENLALVQGAWQIRLLFAHHKQPMKFLQRCIVSHSSKQKAEQTAFYMRRLAAKDQRGTLAVDLNDFSVSSN